MRCAAALVPMHDCFLSSVVTLAALCAASNLS